MSTGDDDLYDTGSVTIEGGWYSDSSSQGSKEDEDEEEQNLLDGDVKIVVTEAEENECRNNGDNVENVTATDPEDYRTEEQCSKLLNEDDKNIYSDSESDDVSHSSSESKNNERLIIHPDIETAKVKLFTVNPILYSNNQVKNFRDRF